MTFCDIEPPLHAICRNLGLIRNQLWCRIGPYYQLQNVAMKPSFSADISLQLSGIIIGDPRVSQTAALSEFRVCSVQTVRIRIHCA